MLSLFLRTYKILSLEERRSFGLYQFTSIAVALIETASVALIAFTFGLFAGNVKAKDMLVEYSGFLGIDQYQESFILYCGFVLIFLLVAATASIYNTWRAAALAYKMGAGLSDRLLDKITDKNFEYFIESPQSQLVNLIQVEAVRVNDNYFYPIVLLSSKITSLLLISVALLLFNPAVFLVSILGLSIVYLLIFKLVKHFLSEQSRKISLASEYKFRILRGVFSSIKDVFIFNAREYFKHRFSKQNYIHSNAVSKLTVLNVFPRYFIEYIILSAVLIVCIFQIHFNSESFSSLLPGLSLYALAALKLLPIVQQIYSTISQMEGNIRSFELVEAEIRSDEGKNSNGSESQDEHFVDKGEIIGEFERLVLSKISYRYPQADRDALHDISISIVRGQSIGIIGSSGSGKTTLANLMLGFLTPSEGFAKAQFSGDGDSVPLNHEGWRRSIGYVSQNVSILNASFIENICFGEEPELRSDSLLELAIQRAHLESVIRSEHDGVYTVIGEDGNKLSGGQRQRVGIARALYRNPSVIFFDEATSALDGATERTITRAIDELKGEITTVTIAHRLSTVRNCDVLYLLDAGSILASGSYQELYETSAKFREMVGPIESEEC